MGRWIELKDHDGNVRDGTTPHPLLHCIRYLPKHTRNEFPVLTDLDLKSDKWNDEWQTLDKERAKRLKEELQRVRNITRFKEFIDGVDNKKFYEDWKKGEDETEFNQHLDRLEVLIQTAIEKGWMLKIEL